MENKDSVTNHADKTSSWVSIIEVTKTPLGFFVFSMLLLEAFFAAAFAISGEENRGLIIYGMISIVAVVIFIVSLFAFFKPSSLFSSSKDANLKSITQSRDELSAMQAKILGFITEQNKGKNEVFQRDIENKFGFNHTSGELFYRLETLCLQGFICKRRIPEDGQFAYKIKITEAPDKQV